MPDPKNFVDSLFDMADSAADTLSKAIKPAPTPEVNDRVDDWEASFNEPKWAPARGDDGQAVWHCFREGQTSVCQETFTSHQIEGRRVLDHGKVIPACSSCIIGVSK